MARAVLLSYRRPHSAARSAQRTALWWALQCALLAAMCLASTLGLVHRALHGAPSEPPSAVRVAGPGVVSAEHAEHAVHTERASHAHAPWAAPWSALFGEHSAGDAECRLYDQLAQGDGAACVPLVVLPLALSQAIFDFFLDEVIVRRIALFDARGPPGIH